MIDLLAAKVMIEKLFFHFTRDIRDFQSELVTSTLSVLELTRMNVVGYELELAFLDFLAIHVHVFVVFTHGLLVPRIVLGYVRKNVEALMDK